MSEPGGPELLLTEGLRKSFGEVHAVDGVDLRLEEGVLTAVIGPNGAGKTTLVNLLSGNVAVDGGRIYFRGEEIGALSVHERVRRGIGRSFQITNVFPLLSVYQNIQIPVLAHLRYGPSFWHRVGAITEVADQVRNLLAAIGLLERAELAAGTLSHGDQRLLEIGIALAAEPRLLLLDEPTAGMNPVERGRVLELISALNAARRTTFVIIEHDMDVVFSLADDVVVLHRGQVLARGVPAAIRANAQVRDVYLGGKLT